MATESVVFDRAANYYDDTRGFPPGEEKQVSALISRVGGLTTDSRVIEVGIGTGRIALPLSAHVRAIYGVDLSRPMMARLRAKQSNEPVWLTEGDITRLPFKSGSFDAAVAVHIFHLVPGWREALHEVARVLKPGAPLISAGNSGRPQDDNEFKPVWDAFNEAVPRYDENTVGAINQDRHEYLSEAGWQAIDEMQVYEYPVNLKPQILLDGLEQRTWSRSWPLSDEEIQRGLQAMHAAIATHFEDPQQPIALIAKFRAQAFLPPSD